MVSADKTPRQEPAVTASTATAHSEDLAQQALVLTHVDAYLVRLTEATTARWATLGYTHEQPGYDYQVGQRYLKVVVVEGGQARSVHSFVDKRTGEVYKSEGWAKPAKGVRFDLLDDASREQMFSTLDPFGGYLYRYR